MLAPARMEAPACLMLAAVCVPLGSEAPPARDPASLAVMANVVYPANVPTTPPVTPRMEPAIACLAGWAPTAPSPVPQGTGEPAVPSPVSVAMVGPATPRMGAASAPQAGLDAFVQKAASLACLVPTAHSHASVVLERSATLRRGPVHVPQGTVAPPAGLVAWSPSP